MKLQRNRAPEKKIDREVDRSFFCTERFGATVVSCGQRANVPMSEAHISKNCIVCDCLEAVGDAGGVRSTSIGIGNDWARLVRIVGFCGSDTDACRDPGAEPPEMTTTATTLESKCPYCVAYKRETFQVESDQLLYPPLPSPSPPRI